MKNNTTIMPNFNFPGQTEIYQESLAEFASRWKQKFSPESVARGKAVARTTAINKKSVSKGIYPMSQGYKDLEQGIAKSQKLSASGKQAMLTKAGSSNRTMKPTTQRGLLKTKGAKNQLSSKSANSFKQGAKNQTTNKANAITRRLQNQADKVTGQGKYKTPLTTPTLNPFEQSSWEKNATKGVKATAPKVKVNSIPFKKSGLLNKIGNTIKRNPVASGAALGAGVGALGYKTYKKMKNNKKR